MDKTLKDKAISIKGKKYILVSDRILFFNENYPNGSINTQLISQPSDELVVVKATVIPNVDKPGRCFSDYSQARWGDGLVNKTAAMENCSTSACGRALAFMGIGVLDSIASADEIRKAQAYEAPTSSYAKVETIVAQTSAIPICKIHNKPMVLRTNRGSGHQFYSCGAKLNNGDYCPNTGSRNLTIEQLGANHV